MSAQFSHFDLRLVEPSFGSQLTDFIIQLDYLRKKRLAGTTHPRTFFQLKELFHTLESIGSARIEGNRTTIAEYIETKIDPKTVIKDEKIIEIQNMEKAMDFIDQNIKEYPVNRMLLGHLHKMVVDNLSPKGEGDHTPGEYRSKNVDITGSKHKPPDYTQVQSYMDELFTFINDDSAQKYDLLKTAIAHHRFVWIHPFGNGNGRTVRLFTYAMLVKQGFNVDIGRIINPTAIFCNDRNQYYQHLERADQGDEAGTLEWCQYVLGGLSSEIEKIDMLLDYSYLSSRILLPAIDFSLERKVITETEGKILKIAVQKQVFQASDLKKLFPEKIPAEVSRVIKRLRDKKMIMSEKENSRKYVMSFVNNYLLRGIIKMLDDNGFLPVND
jgi:Fic family protein